MNPRHEFLVLNDIRFHLVIAGSGPCILLLHGFPESWHSWRNQIRALSSHFTVIAPDLRGYGRTTAPRQIKAYAQETLVDDVFVIAKHFSPSAPIALVGHDWGAAIGYLFCMKYPERVSHFIALSFPHPRDFKNALTSRLSQIRRSWYIFFFQLPCLPELFFSAFRFYFLRILFYSGWAGSATPLSPVAINRYIAYFRKYQFLGTAIDYYRAIFKHPPAWDSTKNITVPTLLLWGEQDPLASAALLQMMNHSRRHFSGSFQFQTIPNAGHFLQQEQAEIVTGKILVFLSGSIIT